MAYTKPKAVAQNKKTGSFAAGCPEHHAINGQPSVCKKCEMTK